MDFTPGDCEWAPNCSAHEVFLKEMLIAINCTRQSKSTKSHISTEREQMDNRERLGSRSSRELGEKT